MLLAIGGVRRWAHERMIARYGAALRRRSATWPCCSLAPVGLVFYRTFEHGFGAAWDAVTTPEALHALWLTVLIALIAVPAEHGLRRSSARC